MPKTNKQIREIQNDKFERTATFDRAAIDDDKRTVSIAFSSEEPVERWFGSEILDHSRDSIRTARLKNGGPVLVDHDHRDHVGVVESVSVDGDRRGRAVVRFGTSERATEIFNDVKDGIRTKISVGYRVHKAVLEEQNDEAPDVYRMTDWEPYEVSIVSVPADDTVGVGRSAEDDADINPDKLNKEETRMTDSIPQATPAASQTPDIDTDEIRATAEQAERNRTNTILKVGEQYDCSDLARQFVGNGQSVDSFREAVLERLGKPTDTPIEPVTVDMTEREHNEYSIVRALNASVTGNWDKAGLEREVSEAIGKQLGRNSEGFFVPTALRFGAELSKRTPLEAGTANIGGNTVATELGSLIDLLRNRMLVKQMGAQVLSGLEGDLAFPRQTAGGTLYWVGETPGADVTESNQTIDQVSLTPKTAQATNAYSRQLLAQSSLDIEAFVRNDLTLINALGLDLAALNGSGASNQPTGILNVAGIGDVAGGTDGAAPTWDNITQLEQEVAVDNADMGTMGYLTNAIMRGKMKRTEKASSTGQFIWGDMGGEPGFGELNGYRAGVSNQVPSNLTKGLSSDCSAIVFGNWNDLLIGEWGVMELIVDPYALKKQGLIEITSIMMVDIAVRHAESFAAMQDARDV